MKILPIVTSMLIVFGTTQLAQAGSRHGHHGHKHGYKNGHNVWGATRHGHKPRHYGYKPKYNGHNHHGHRGGYLLGGLFLGALLGHALTRSSYQSDPGYTTYSTTTTYEGSAPPQSAPFEEGRYRERLMLGADGSCTLVTRDPDGKETWQELASTEC